MYSSRFFSVHNNQHCFPYSENFLHIFQVFLALSLKTHIDFIYSVSININGDFLTLKQFYVNLKNITEIIPNNTICVVLSFHYLAPNANKICRLKSKVMLIFT